MSQMVSSFTFQYFSYYEQLKVHPQLNSQVEHEKRFITGEPFEITFELLVTVHICPVALRQHQETGYHLTVTSCTRI